MPECPAGGASGAGCVRETQDDKEVVVDIASDPVEMTFSEKITSEI